MFHSVISEPIPKTIDELLCSRDWDEKHRHGEIISFHTAERHDVYNITAPFEYEGELTIAGRTEERTDEVRTLTRFFRQENGIWAHDESLPSLALQDPFVSVIAGQWIVGGVKVYPLDGRPDEVGGWETHIYTGDNLRDLHLLVVGPYKMKDIRLVELQEKVGVFTRPQGGKGGLGKIGFTTVPSLEDITPQLLLDAPILPGLFSDNEWGGVNEAHALEDGRIGVVGHIARYTDGREYYPMTFIFDPRTNEISQQQIIASRSCFPETASKKPDTEKVSFSGGLRRLGRLATWYGGLSDTSAGILPEIPNPFLPDLQILPNR